MVAAALPPEDTRLLQSWFLAKGDLSSLTTQEKGPSAVAWIAWTRKPEVREALADLQALIDLSDRFHRSCTHRAAIDKLVHVLNTSDNLIELRRTATTILRGPTTPREPRKSAGPHRPAPPPGELPASSLAASHRATQPLSSPPVSALSAAPPPHPGGADRPPAQPGSASKPVAPPLHRPGRPTNRSLSRAAGAPMPHTAPSTEILESIELPHTRFAAHPRAP